MGGRHWEGNLLYQNVQSGHSSTKQNETKKKKPVRKRQKACDYSDGNHDAMMRQGSWDSTHSDFLCPGSS